MAADTDDVTATKADSDNELKTQAAVPNGGAEEEELAGTRRLFNRDPVTGVFDEHIVLSPIPTKSPNDPLLVYTTIRLRNANYKPDHS
jgi:hypothetical protein